MRLTSASTFSSVNAVAAAHWAGWLAPVVVCDCSAAMALVRCGGASAAPIRQPVIAYALLAP